MGFPLNKDLYFKGKECGNINLLQLVKGDKRGKGEV